MAHLVVSQNCDINEEIQRIAMREAVHTELTLTDDLAKMKSEMEEKCTWFMNKINTLEAELSKLRMEVNEDVKKDMMQDVAWQALHAAAAAACRGVNPTDGKGQWANGVMAKLNTESCDKICAATSFNICDADISVQGFYGKADSYTETVGSYNNYGCSTPGNTDVRYDEVKADEDAIISGSNPHYFRYCCCRKALKESLPSN